MEQWDLLDHNRIPTGQTHPRGTPLPEGCYHNVVSIWAANREGKFLLMRRAPEKKTYAGCWGSTGGSVLAGETSRNGALRELWEETGYTAKELIPLGKFYPACAYSDETIWMYLAKGLTKGERHLDEDEFLDVELIPLSELVKQVMAGEIPDAKTQIAILKAAVHEGLLK